MIFRRLAENFHWTREEVLNLTLNEVRMYMADEKILGQKMKFKTQQEFQKFREATKARNRDLVNSIAARIREEASRG